MKTQQICIFPGLGSEEQGMGDALFQKYSDYITKANRILGYDVSKLCLENPTNRVHQTPYVQPALYVVNALHYLEYLEKYGQPDAVLGHSLGEFNALWAAGVYNFETGLKIVQVMGEMMATVKNGTMAAVIGMELWEIEEVLQKHFSTLEICTINTYTQIVIGGNTKVIEQAADFFDECGVGYVPMKVNCAFHSIFMKEIQAAFGTFLNQFQFASPEILVLSNVTAKPFTQITVQTLLTQQMCAPIQWLNCIEYLLKQGECHFFETGPKTVLSNLVKKIQRDFQAIA